MTFLVERISYSAQKRRIVRPVAIEGETLTIGRHPSSNIRLADLNAALRHAVVQRVGPMKLQVSAEEGLGVELDGRKLTSGVIDLATGGDLRIGKNLLRFAPTAAGSEDIRVEVEEVGESAADEKDRSDVGRFASGSVMPSKRIASYALAVVVLAIFLAWPLWIFNQRQEAQAQQEQSNTQQAATGDRRKMEQERRERAELRPVAGFAADRLWISGHLSQAHASLENNCGACHVRPFEPVNDGSCMTCHRDITNHGDTERQPQDAAARLARSQPNLSGFDRFQLTVAEAFGHQRGRCVDCHREHEGPTRLADTLQSDCAGCHADLSNRLTGVRFANVSDFGRNAPRPDPEAHPEFRPLALINWDGDRPQLGRVPLRGARENSNLAFPHELHLDREGGVARMAQRLGQRYGGRQGLGCADCHTATPDGTSFQPINMEEDCSACHSLGFEQQGNVVRTLRHGAPDQVVADLREFYRGRAPARPPELSPAARRGPGDIGQVRSALHSARARAGASMSATQAIQRVFQRDGACGECHIVDQQGPLDFHVRPVAFPTRYLLHGWFSHAPHRRTEWPRESPAFQRGAVFEGDQACLSCHTQAPRSRAATDLMLPDMASCQSCHGGEGGRREAVESGCAMCHDYHLNQGVPAMLVRRQARGQRWHTTVTPVARLTAAR
ncbi:MAG TPA: cytochrome c3 family protein [Allosphingosinicella sp.]